MNLSNSEQDKDLGESPALSAAAGAAILAEAGPFPPDLAAVIEAWPGLPEEVKAGILAMVRAAGDGAED